MRRDLLILLVMTISLIQWPSCPSHNSNLANRYHLAQGNEQIRRHWTVNIILVNYEPSVLNTDIFMEDLPTQRIHSVDDLTLNYTIDYSLKFANQSYSNHLLSVIETNSVNGSETGTKINETKLEYQKE
ncbi:MAG: hypothetical protein R6V83_03820, partial [Candidatus Thorarchaeota archaeon]